VVRTATRAARTAPSNSRRSTFAPRYAPGKIAAWYWHASGLQSCVGISAIPTVSAVWICSGIRPGSYLAAGALGGSIIADDGRTSRFPSEVAFTDKAHAILDGWPGAAPRELVDNLLAVLAQTAAEEQDPARRRRLEALAAAVKDVGVSVASQVMAKVITGAI
jgi:hypothetical protein